LTGDKSGLYKSLALLSDSVAFAASSLSLPCSALLGEFFNTSDFSPHSHRIPQSFDRWVRHGFVVAPSGADLEHLDCSCYALDALAEDRNGRVGVSFAFKDAAFEVTTVRDPLA
jgi:hypothetical protein